ncbi:MAG: hypothetical protein ABH914_03750 [Candidatus Omnitrophota bacterium]
MKIINIVGARPNFMKIAPIMRAMRAYSEINAVLVHTGQHYYGNMLLTTMAVILFMSLLGFLPYNFHPARIFLGDAGSGFLGFMLGLMAVMATSKPYSIIKFIAPILVICVPVLDMAFAILRRAIRKRPLFIGDRDHIYDLLLKRGWSQPKVWGVLCIAQFVLVVAAVVI